MGQGIFVNMWVCPGPYLPEPGSGIQLSGVGAMEWQAPTRKMYDQGRSGGIKNENAGILGICPGKVNGRFGEERSCWTETEMGKS